MLTIYVAISGVTAQREAYQKSNNYIKRIAT